MSTHVMALCWPLKMPQAAKAVLISLADNANDHGECWPSITTIAARTCLADRSVQRAIHWLEGAGYLSADRSNGRHTRYVVHPNQRQTVTHDTVSPVTESHIPTTHSRQPTTESRKGVTESPSNRKEPSRTVNKSNHKKAPICSVECPSGVSEQIWSDWLILRKAKKAPVTETALATAIREAGKAHMTLESFLEIWCARGSQGLEASWLKPHERADAVNGKPSAAANFHGKVYKGTAEEDLPPELREQGHH